MPQASYSHLDDYAILTSLDGNSVRIGPRHAPRYGRRPPLDRPPNPQRDGRAMIKRRLSTLELQIRAFRSTVVGEPSPPHIKPRTIEQVRLEHGQEARKILAAKRKLDRTRQRPYYRLTPFMKSIKPLTSRPNRQGKPVGVTLPSHLSTSFTPGAESKTPQNQPD